ncbi:LOW QUALITY PROTEIN: serpin B6-like [Nasonia vitripennis]|uniref:Serpin domain-containing protein n=1 Tax=Nasonia vitripennis TaxID=7425 RepID=A0A7M7Q8Z5_NASVI|nr:LOW QUALITY PROTEIN: serpin B6-like [Nasonia vitripennis]
MSQRYRMYVSNNVSEDEYEFTNDFHKVYMYMQLHLFLYITFDINNRVCWCMNQSISNGQEKNFVSSALSAHVVLSMCAYGAKEKTAEEMKSALHLPASIYWESFKYLLKTMDVSSIDERSNEIKDRMFLKSESEIGIANKLLIDKNIVVRDSYKEAMESIFHSEITEVDFVNDGRNVIRYVNNWCAKTTCDKIREILPPKKPIEPTTKLMLLNVIYFKAYWQHKFNPALTSMDEFHIDAEKTMQVHMTEKNAFHRTKCCRCNSNFLNYKEDFKIDSSKDYTTGYMHTNKNIFYVNLSLPKFTIETTIDLQKNLIKLGMPTMFTDKANFKDISIKPVLVPRLHVSEVIQKAFIVVNEEGTEAVAVTRLTVTGGGSVEIREFKIDRPFLYRIVHKSTNVTLFSRCVYRPKY